jgi:hypothetical protein
VSVQRHDLHLLTGAYALDAIDGTELARFERHMDRCAACREEVRGLRETAGRLAMATAITPPAAMRQQVLDAAARTRQLAPAGRKPRLAGRWRTSRRPRVTLRSPVVLIAVPAMAAAIVVLIVLQVMTLNRLQVSQASNRSIAAVLSAPDARIKTSTTSVGGTVTAVVSASDHEAVITTTGMPAPSDTKVYQLWVISSSGARSAGLLPAGHTGTSTPVLADGINPGDHLGITIEPAGGTTKPTTSPIVLIAS